MRSLTLLFLVGACSRAPQPSVLRIAAAASLRELITDSEAAFRSVVAGASLIASFDASSTLSRQIQAGAGFDVFLSADRETMGRIKDFVVPGSEVVFLRNRLVVIGAAGASLAPQSADELVQLQGKLALAAPAVPAGRYARAWLGARGVLSRLELRVVNADNVRAALALVEAGAADAAVVYATDARLAKKARVLFEVPASEDPGVTYVAAALRGEREASAQAYLLWLGGAEFLDLAQRRGFLPPR